jgi:hypothetical protein
MEMLGAVSQRHETLSKRGGARQQIETLKNEANQAVPQPGPFIGRRAGNLLSIQPILPGAGTIQTAENVHQRALARAAGPHQRDQFPFGTERVTPFEHLQIHSPKVVGLANVVQFKQFHNLALPS